MNSNFYFMHVKWRRYYLAAAEFLPELHLAYLIFIICDVESGAFKHLHRDFYQKMVLYCGFLTLMNMKSSFLALSILLLLTQCVAQNKPNTMNSIDYEKAWKEVTEFENKGLPESALKVVEGIAKQAKAENNAAQLVKAIIHRMKFRDAKEEDAFAKNMVQLKQEAAKATFPVKPLLHSMLGELYWQYYQNNRYRFMNRTEIVNFDTLDLETWSLNKILDETHRQYKLSLEDAEKSKKEVIDIYEPVVNQGNALGRTYRPTLYDFLAHRALDYFMSEEPEVTKPAYAFELDKSQYIDDANVFVNVKLETKDSLSIKFHALTILQELVKFHLKDTDPAAFVDVDLKRLKFVQSHLIHPDPDLFYKSLEKLEERVKDHPTVGLVVVERARLIVERAARYKPLLGDSHKWDLKTAYNLCEETKKRFPDSDGAILCENLQEDILNKSINGIIEANNIPAQPFRGLVRYRNISDVHYRIVKVTTAEVQDLRRKLDRVYDQREEKFIQHFTAKAPVKTGSYKLPDDGDYQEHSIEVKLDALPEGEYMVLFSAKADFSVNGNGLAYAFTRISNISYLHRTSPGGMTEIFIRHRESGDALPGVVASVFTQRYNYKKDVYEKIKIGTFTSDVNGYIKIDYLKSDNRSFSLDLVKGADFNSTENLDQERYYSSGSIHQYVSHPPEMRTETFFFLDRGIYRPGQTIYFKGLVVDTDGKRPKIKAGYKTRVILYDVNQQQQGEISVTTNAYGTFNGVLTAPSGGLTGDMRLETTDQSGQVSFSVEEYKRPKFEVQFTPVTASFRLNDQIKAEGFARAYSGANIDGAAVTYRVVRVANFPIWWWYRWGNYPTSPAMEIARGTAITDANGKFEVNFEAIPDATVDRASDPTFTYTISADVTDINGETHTSSTSIAVGYKSLLIDASIGNVNKDDERLKKEFTITTTNLAGQYQGAKGQVKISLLKPPAKAFRERLWLQPDKQLYTATNTIACFHMTCMTMRIINTNGKRNSKFFNWILTQTSRKALLFLICRIGKPVTMFSKSRQRTKMAEKYVK
jgi:hypothetical protein